MEGGRPAGPSGPPSASTTLPWQCRRCTLQNSPRSAVCAACHLRREVSASTSPQLPAAASDGPMMMGASSSTGPALRHLVLPMSGPSTAAASTASASSTASPLTAAAAAPSALFFSSQLDPETETEIIGVGHGRGGSAAAAAAGGGGATGGGGGAAGGGPGGGGIGGGAAGPGGGLGAPPHGDTEEDRQMRVEIMAQLNRGKDFLPFIALLIILFAYKHILGLLMYCSLVNMLRLTSSRCKAELDLKDGSRKSLLFVFAFMALFFVVFIFQICRDDDLLELWTLAFPTLERHARFYRVLWRLGMNDLAIRFATLCAKCVVGIGLCNGRNNTPQCWRVKRRLFTPLSTVSLMIRHAIATPVWMVFFQNETLGSMSFDQFGELTLLYFCLKVFIIVTHLRRLGQQVVWMMPSRLSYGRFVSAAEVTEAGSPTCSICLAQMSDPISLPCNHMFCKNCIEEWLDRERRCPNCRATVPGAGDFGGDGSVSMLPVIL